MDPDIACWVRNSAGLRNDHGHTISWNIPVGLKDMSSILTPQHVELRERHHSADVDATMCWLICRELLRGAGGLSEQRERPRGP